MSWPLRIEILVIFGAIFVSMIVMLAKNRIPLKYALIWLIASLVMILAAIFPALIDLLRSLLGFQLVSNVILAVFLGLTIVICICLTVIVSDQYKKIHMLIQELSLLKGEKKE